MTQPRNNAMRGCRGEKHPRSKLTDAQVEQMIEDRAGGLTLVECGQRYGVRPETVSRLTHGKGRRT